MKDLAGLIGYGIANLLIGAAAVWSAYLLFELEVFRARAPLAMMQGVFLAYFTWIAVLAIAGVVHELGHGGVAYALHLRLIYALLGPLRLSFGGNTLRAGWNRRWLASPFSVAFAPAVGGSSRRAWAMALLGGPMASLALAGAAFAGHALLRDPSSYGAAVLTGLSWFALAGFVGNLVPGQVGLKRTDGGHLLAVLRHEPQLESTWLLAGIVAAWTSGSRPREVSAQDLGRLTATEGTPNLRAMALTIALHVARDRGDVLSERSLAASLAPLAGELANPLRASACCELAITLTSQAAVDQAVGWLERARRARPDADDLWRAEAAVAFAQGHDLRARLAIAKARAAIARMPTAGLVAPFTEAMDEIERRLDAQARERREDAIAT